jgi:hypothetical protein
MKSRLTFLTGLVLTALVSGAEGGNIYWQGDVAAAPSEWINPANWNASAVPGAGDHALVHNWGASTLAMPVISSNVGTVATGSVSWHSVTANLTVTTGGDIHLNTFFLGNDTGSNATLNVTGGSFTSTYLYVGQKGVGRVNLQSGLVYVSECYFGQDLGQGGVGSFNIENGTFLLNGNHTAEITEWKDHDWLTAFDGNAALSYGYNPSSNLTTVKAAAVDFDDDGLIVYSTSSDLAGKAMGFINRGMWYEVRAGAPDGPMVDYGALRAQTDWSITVRHLQLGDNFVTIYGVDDYIGILSDTITVTLQSDFAKGSVRPRPYPSEIWFGGLSSDNPSLASEPDQWPFVQKYVDGIMFHSFADGFWTGTSRADLAALLEPYNMRYIEEMGDGVGNTTFSGISPDYGWGAVVKSRENSNVYLTEIAHDYKAEYMQDFCQAHPEWSANANLEWFTGETYGAPPEQTYPHGGWRKAFSDYHYHFPHAKVSQTKSTVYYTWESYPILAGAIDGLLYDPLRDDEGNIILVGGNPVTFIYTLDQIVSRHLYSALDVGLGTYHYWTDFPWGWFGVWGDRSSAAVNREKIRYYEQYLQDNGGGHGMVCNSAVGEQPTQDEWDSKYKDESLKNLYLHQAEGGRADKYIFESWYAYDVGGVWYARPYCTVPEDKPGSYSNLAKDAIKYLKGIKNIDGTLEALTITVIQLTEHQYEVQVRNDGDIACLPVLLALESGSDGIHVDYTDSDTVDIRDRIISEQGYIWHDDFTIYETDNIDDKLLQPGGSFSILVSWSIGSQGTLPLTKTIEFEAFWNPQDPTGIIRDKKNILISLSCDDVLVDIGGQFINPELSMDLSGSENIPDCHVDAYDMQEFAYQWLDSYHLSDFAELALEWLQCNDPSDADCSWPYSLEPTVVMDEGFETGDFSAYDWQHSASGSKYWTVVNTGVYEGVYSARPGPITHNQNTSIRVSVTVPTGETAALTFYKKVSSEKNFDCLWFYIDGVEKAKWSGYTDNDTAWTKEQYNVSAGSHTLKWEYTKDGSVNSGSDCAWLDNIKLVCP